MSSSTLSAIESFIKDPQHAEYLALVKGARNGLVYGAKIRFPHALVMAILFGKGDWTSRVQGIIRATRTHATNLATFVFLYKSLLLLQKKFNGGKVHKADTFIAGLIGGYIVFGEQNPINEQIVLYVTSRVVATIIPRAYPPSAPSATTPYPRPVPPSAAHFSIFAALTWGAVMYLFKERGYAIQPGMWKSMVYLYRDSDHWDSLRTLLWHNE